MGLVFLLILAIGSSAQDVEDVEDEKQQMMQAYKYAEAGDYFNASIGMRRAMQYFPYKSNLPSDYGAVLLKLTIEANLEAASREPAVRQACAAIHLGELLGDPRGSKLSAKCKEYISDPEEASWKTLTKRVAAAQAVDAKPVEGAVDLCSPDVRGTGQGFVLTIKDSEIFEGRLSMETLLNAYTSMIVCGVLALNGTVFPVDFVEVLAKEQQRVLDEYLAQREATDAAKDAHTFARKRGEGRFEVTAPPAAPFNDDRLVANPFVLQLVRLLLGSRVEIDTLSQVSALPGAVDQNWHTDVEPLFREAGPSVHHPPAGLVMVVPLCNQTFQMGPTEFQAGSHRLQGITDQWERQMSTFSLPVVRPSLNMGSVSLFDLRLNHRGTRNMADTHRPILYISYVKEWWVDVRNFQAKQSENFDTMSPLRKKLLKRLDHRAFVEGLSDFAAGKAEKPPEQCAAFQENDLQI